MDWQKLFLSANGRIGIKDFWIGFAILFVAGLVLGMIPFLGMLIGIALIYPQVCIFSKRLHDIDKSGWLYLLPMGVMVAALILAAVLGGAAMIGMGQANGEAGAIAAGGGALLVIGLATLFNLAFLLWVGLSKGTPGDNRYGPAPAGAAMAETFS